MTVARVFINGMDAEAFRQSFHVIFTAVKTLHPKFEVGKSLHGIIMDWSDAQIKELEEDVGPDVAAKVMKGCRVRVSYRLYKLSP